MKKLSKKKKQHDSDSDEEVEVDPKLEYRFMYDRWVTLSNENLQLAKDKLILKAKVKYLKLSMN